jgi:hypothetical protein
VYYETQRGCVGQSPTFSFRSMASPEYAVAVGAGFCAGDCDGDGEVTIDELISMVNIGFEPALIDDCDAGDDDGDGAIRIEELVLAVSNSLLGCNRGTLLPDLVALGVFPSEFVSPPYLPATNRVCVMNQGAGDAGPFTVFVDWPNAPDEEVQFAGIPAGEDRCVETTPPARFFDAELDERNNSGTYYVPIP